MDSHILVTQDLHYRGKPLNRPGFADTCLVQSLNVTDVWTNRTVLYFWIKLS